MKAKQWLQRGQAAQDPFNAMGEYWRGFNNLFSDFPGNNERERILSYIAKTYTQASATALLAQYAEQIAYLISRPVIDMRGNGHTTAPNIETFKNANDSLRKLQQVFMIIYQVRCNLEHGEKSPLDERDQHLCQAAAPIVAHAVGQPS